MPCCLCERHTEIKNCNHNKPIQILYLLSNAGRETTERGARDDRIWGERRPNLGRGTTASGTAFAIKSGLAVPYDSTMSDGTEVLVGFVFTDTPVDPSRGNVTFPGIWTGRIRLSKLPSTVTAAAKTSGLFVWEA